MKAGEQRIVSRIILALCVTLTLLYLGFFVHGYMQATDYVGKQGLPLANDFTAFWAASHLVLEGRSALVYDLLALRDAQSVAVPAMDWSASFIRWNYPPSYFFVIWPLAFLDYYPSFVAWSVFTLIAYAAVGLAIYRHYLTPWLLAAFPGTLVCLSSGQNGLLTAAILGLGFRLLREQPILAGVCFGILSVKPQIAPLVPVLLICCRQWTAFASAAVTTVLAIVASGLVFGWDDWQAFITAAGELGATMENTIAPLSRMPSVYATLRLLEVPASLAMGAHFTIAVGVVVTVARSCWRHGATDNNIALAIIGGCLISPYILDYDHTILAIALLFMARAGGQFPRWQTYLMILLWFSPILNPVATSYLGLQLSWVLLIIIVYMGHQRAARLSI